MNLHQMIQEIKSAIEEEKKTCGEEEHDLFEDAFATAQELEQALDAIGLD